MPRVLLLLPTTTYRSEAFLTAAARVGVDVTVASESPNALGHLNPTGLLTLNFSDVDDAVERVREFSATYPLDAVVPVDSQVTVVSAAICQSLGLRHNPVQSVVASQDKHHMRQLLKRAGVASPRFRLCGLDEDRASLAGQLDYPCVVKPLSLAASQGVIRADDQEQFVRAVDRLEAILKREYASLVDSSDAQPVEPCVQPSSNDKLAGQFLVEEFIRGPEVALEGMLTRGDLSVIALFDKPDSMDGPFFEESIYVTPSRLATAIQESVGRQTQEATRALGLTEGPIHAELRITDSGPYVTEVNPRSIGGLCSRALRFGTAVSLEELIIRRALDEDFELLDREHPAAGVMMVPIPHAGRLSAIRGLAEAKAVSGIDGVTISAHLGQQLVPLPEGSQYLGFIFSRADSPAAAELALRESHARLEFVIEPVGDETRQER